eukprot:13908275-Alexandrium_andersonii.AAC.1
MEAMGRLTDAALAATRAVGKMMLPELPVLAEVRAGRLAKRARRALRLPEIAAMGTGKPAIDGDPMSDWAPSADDPPALLEFWKGLAVAPRPEG